MPFVAHSCCNCCAYFKIWSGSAVEDKIRFIGKFSPPVGSGGGVTMNMRMPGSRFTIICVSGTI